MHSLYILSTDNYPSVICHLSSLNQLSSTYTAKPKADAAATRKTATCTENDEVKA